MELQRAGGACVRVAQRELPCPICGGLMNVQKTFIHSGLTLAHGAFEARETVLQCATGCQREGHLVRRRQPELAELLVPRSTMGYDVMAHVGIARFVHHQQREAIRADLAQTYGLPLSTGEISLLAERFLIYLKALHVAKAPRLRERLDLDGGWPMHVDATGEAGRGTLLVVWAGWRHWVLGSWKLPSENAEAIVPQLRTIRELFGTPCGIMRDLGRAAIRACLTFVKELAAPIPIWGCHFHLVRDVGKDLLAGSYDQLRSLFRQHGARAHLNALARELSRALGDDLPLARKEVEGWAAPPAVTGHQVPAGRAGTGVVRSLTQWVLDYAAHSRDAGFPFDLPYLDLFGRCLQGCRAVEAYLHHPSDDAQVRDLLERLHRILVVVRQPGFASPLRILAYRRGLLDELRGALRVEAKPERTPLPSRPPGRASPQDLEEAHAVKEALDRFVVSLRERRPDRGPGEDAREAIDLILAHLDRHGDTLSGHALALPPRIGGGVRMVDRTNMCLEHFFGELKHGERRRSGRKNLAADLESLPGAAPLALNLTRPDYLAILCGDLELLPKAFAELDATDRTRSLPARLASHFTGTDLEDARTSLPRPDRKLVRSPELLAKFEKAARSRAPLRPPPQVVASA